MKVSLCEVKAGYNAIKKLAKQEFKKGNYEKSLDYIDKAAIIASQIMWRYADEDLELLLESIGKSVIKSKENFIPISNRVVFYDYFGSSFILTLQYIRALIKLDYQILYIYEERNNLTAPVVEIIKEYDSVIIEKIPLNINRISRINNIYYKIVDFNPVKLFIHINTLSVAIPTFYSLPDGITKYYINLGDHAYWLGTKAIDFSIEFRNFGATVSREKRGLNNKQLLLLPYYPIIDKKEFRGFPEIPEETVIIFSGGDFYKTIDGHYTFWSLVKEILEQNPKAVILFANKALNNKAEIFLNSFIKENNLHNRLIPIGFREDLNEVMKHCDVYLGTCPMSGGLMSQHAAVNSKPILQYYPKELISFEETESMICFNEKISISFDNKKELLKEAKRLIDDKEYRIIKGKQLSSCMINENDFNHLFSKTIDTNKTQIPIEFKTINYKAIEKWWLDINNHGFYDAGGFINKVLGNYRYLYVPFLAIKYIYITLYRKISERIKKLMIIRYFA
jgi:hypothetical protein